MTPAPAVFLAALVTFALPLAAAADDGTGLVAKRSPHSVEVTAERFERAAADRGMKIFPRYDHAEAAREYGQELRPTVVIAFGNPAYGTPFMARNQAAGIDFPPKAVVYEDADGQVWIAYNSAEYLFGPIYERHGLEAPEGDAAFYADLLDSLSDRAVAPAD